MSIINLKNMYYGKRTFYINGIDEKIWYDNFKSNSSEDVITLRCDSLMSEVFDRLGKNADCIFDKSNYAFELENDTNYAFSMGSYAVIYNKGNGTYKKIMKFSYVGRTFLTDEDIKRIIKLRTKQGKRYK